MTTLPPDPLPPDPAPRGSAAALAALYSRVLRELLTATAAIIVLGIVGGYLVDGLAGVLGAVLGVGAALLFSGTTVLSMRASLGRPPTTLAAVVLGAWVVKMVILVAIFAVLQDMTFYNRYVFAVVLFVVVLTSMVIDVRAVVQARIPHAEGTPGTRH